MKTIKLLSTNDGDWDILLVDGKVYHEGHSIPDFVYLDLLSDLGCSIQTRVITDQEALDGTYEK